MGILTVCYIYLKLNVYNNWLMCDPYRLKSVLVCSCLGRNISIILVNCMIGGLCVYILRDTCCTTMKLKECN